VKWSFQVARIAGIDVKIHATFLLLLAWLGFVYYAEGGVEAAVAGLSFIVLLFVCVVLHEFGHALAARGYGIRTPDITLLPIGGVARLERMPGKPWQELVVALAGPAVNVVIAFGLWLVMGRFLGSEDLARVAQGESDLLGDLLAINVMLVVFNLVPAFPMDGGRVLRSLLALRMKHSRATRIAAVIGQGIAVIFGTIGLFGHPMLLFIAIFVFFGAQQEAAYALMKEAMDETHVSSLMDPAPLLLSPGMPVIEAAKAAILQPAEFFPVVDGNLRLLGKVPASTLAEAIQSGTGADVGSIMAGDVASLRADAPLAQAIDVFRASSAGIVVIVNSAGQMVGILRRDKVSSALPVSGNY